MQPGAKALGCAAKGAPHFCGAAMPGDMVFPQPSHASISTLLKQIFFGTIAR
ncbi:hypothetical protein BSIN_0444 [Burkholderia singularis]|uniref:Uncharacterized protein n=1 Tax=Burkholderia singularis TaxID=1503053 RepID=A0A238H6D9_9BURK|nr:hypothetical protein BSIN_0444 [Burkholderia singularis]